MKTFLDFHHVNTRVELNNMLVEEWRECLENLDASRGPCEVLRERALNSEKGLIEIAWKTL